ncbi:peptide MFS transporter [Thiotrichales bacterium 19S9-12]|nr:peptide MFS transporter [Thiotrichales bacterium 19S9-11]MCF6810907.1 peptide MFS transporter [Thiotrichales bacterium 19S9-12]
MNIKSDQFKVLSISSLTEFAERYSYYVIQALLIFFLIEQFKLSSDYSANLVGTVLAMIYLSALVGGYIADRLIGYYLSAFLGSLFMILGSSILALSYHENVMFLGLAFISISTGLIKSNISSFIGYFYDKAKLSHSHRDFGFSIFYVGINLGSFFALLFASLLKEHYGFQAPFYSSILVSAVMTVILFSGFFLLKSYIEIKVDKKLFGNMFMAMIVIGLYIVFVYYVLKHPRIADFIILLVALSACFLIYLSAQRKYYKRALIASCFFLLSILYWALYFQIFISILLFIDYVVAHEFLGIVIKSSQFLSIESLGVLIFGALMGKLWLSFGKRGMPVEDIDKFNIAFIIMSLMFVVFYFSVITATGNSKVPAIIFIIGFLMLSISELSLSAIGLSLVTKIAPPKFVSLYMGIWLVTIGLGGKLAGIISSHLQITPNIIQSKEQMSFGLLLFIALSILGVVICFSVRRLIIRNTKLIKS